MQKITFTLIIFFIAIQSIYAQDKNTNRWERNHNMVTDKKLKLTWQDSAEVVELEKTFAGAKKYCEELVLSTYNNWRLPEYKELLSLIDYSVSSPTIHAEFKYTNVENNYWSNTKHIDKSGIWVIYFYNGTSYFDEISTENNVRCVRSKNE